MVLEYLKEYENLCKKYKLIIDGCGCCGSPFVEIEAKKGVIYSLENIKLQNNKLYFNIKQSYYGGEYGEYFYKKDVTLKWLEKFIKNNFKDVD